jgi:hypothetical protein
MSGFESKPNITPRPRHVRATSALPPKADNVQRGGNVCFVPITDIGRNPVSQKHVRWVAAPTIMHP